MIGYIYIILNKKNNKYYLGSTKNKHVRKLSHFNKLRKNKHHSQYLQNSFNKYGENNFEFIIIETCYKFREREQFLLDNKVDFKDSYNISKSASGGNLLHNHPDREKLIKQATANILKAQQPNPRYGKDNPGWKGGKTFCKKCNNRINSNKSNLCIKCLDKSGKNNPMFGKKLSKEAKQKLSKFRKGKYFGKQNRPVIIEGKEYISLSEAARQLNIDVGTVLYRIKNIRNNPKYNNYNYK